ITGGPLAGKGLVSASALSAAGFDSVTLEARSLDSINHSSTVPGQIRFTGDVSWSLGRQLTLDAASIVSDGGRATLSAPHVAMGQSYLLAQLYPNTGPLAT